MPKHRDFDRTSLPHPWEDVALFIQKFITYEGHFGIIFNYQFAFLAHLSTEQLINIPYYLLKSLKHVAKDVKGEKHPETYVTNHALIKLIIMHSLQI